MDKHKHKNNQKYTREVVFCRLAYGGLYWYFKIPGGGGGGWRYSTGVQAGKFGWGAQTLTLFKTEISDVPTLFKMKNSDFPTPFKTASRFL